VVESPKDWIKICSLDELLAAVENGEPWGIALKAKLDGRDTEQSNRGPPGSTQIDQHAMTLPLPF
jgi:hypothetical protein